MKTKIIPNHLIPLLLAISMVLPGGTSASEALFDYVMSMEQYKQHRAQQGIPSLTEDDIRDVLDGDIVTKKEDVNDEGLRYVYAVRILDVDPREFWITVIDRANYAHVSKNITESIISRAFDNHFYTYNVLDAPMVSRRHQVLDVYTNPKLFEASEGRIWEQYWHRVTDMSPEIDYALKSSALTNIAPEDVKDAVEVAYNKGSWYIYALPDGRTWAETYIINDPGGRVPQWLVNTVSTKATKDTFDAYETWARSGRATAANNRGQRILSPSGAFLPVTEVKQLLQLPKP